jgi:hypothetical protein
MEDLIFATVDIWRRFVRRQGLHDNKRPNKLS